MRPFDAILIADWSSKATPSPARPSADAIWIAEWRPGAEADAAYHRTRRAAEAALRERLDRAAAAGERILLGFDFAFGYPEGFAARLTGHAHAFAVWDWLDAHLTDGPDNANDRFGIADRINALFPGVGPFWGHPQGRDFPRLTMRDERCGHGIAPHRATETAARGQPQSALKLWGPGSVGSQSLVGLPMLARLRRRRYAGRLGVWPFEDHALDRGIVVAEVYPSLIPVAPAAGEIRDELQVRALASALGDLQAHGGLDAAFASANGRALHEEGWILGVGVEADLQTAAAGRPRLRDDCFALPPGVDWTPVDEALERLRAGLTCVVGAEAVCVRKGEGRILAVDAIARRSNPPAANAAVDGYGFAHAAAGPPCLFPLVEGRAAAGAPHAGDVPPGHAIRVLTGAVLPPGVDTVVLQEDARVINGRVEIRGEARKGANVRRAGEDIAEGAIALRAGSRLRPPDLALLSAVGLDRIEARRRLRVAVLSTGDEIAEAGATDAPHATYDANRPMLLSLVARWGYEAVDCGHVPDRRDALRERLDDAGRRADAILTSGGASAGEEDHVSALLRAEGALSSWRIAVKPGRPLAMALWRGAAVFGLPGNPVAAFVCSLIFARPALSVLAGAAWSAPRGFQVPAAFSKRKKPGRREFLRARLDEAGSAEVFASEGSGRITGLSWADGLVELPDEAADIRPGDPVRFLPYASFGV